MRAGVITYVLLLAGCFRPAPQAGAPCSDTRDCPSGLECTPDNRCEPPGTYVMPDAPPDACPEVVCDGDMLVGCGAATACANGCGGAAPHCLQLAPSNGVTPALLVDATADVDGVDYDFDTETGYISVSDAGTLIAVIRPAGTGLLNGIRFEVIDGAGVFAARSWTLTGADDSDGVGSNTLVLYAATTIDIGTVLDVGGAVGGAGPGGSSANNSTSTGTCRGRAGRSNSGIGATFGEGGGGGGGATGGGDGAASNQPNPTGIGGAVCAANPTTIPLRGGNGGGNGAQTSANNGGGGGGAIMLVAMESVTISGAVTAPGGQGENATTNGNGGGGGGGGGAVFIEAPVVTISGQATANGGGGGAPAGGNNGTRGHITNASVATGGTFSCIPTPGGTAVTRRGGAGGAGTTAPTNATTCTIDDGAGVILSSQGGGGGGAVGRIEIRRRTSAISGIVSPAPSLSTATFE